MALHDFVCPECGFDVVDLYIPTNRMDDHVETCRHCGAEMEQRFTPTFRGSRFVPFTDHHIHPEGKPVRITSVRQREKLMTKWNLGYQSEVGSPGCEV